MILKRLEIQVGRSATETLAQSVCDVCTAALGKSLAHGRVTSLALTGGRTPEHYLPRLFAAPLDWERVVITLADDRLVPADHADSNAGLVMRCRSGGAANGARFVPLTDGSGSADEAAAKAATMLKWEVPLPLDIALLGMGEDGHIASLFPQLSPNLTEPSLCIGVAAPPPPHKHARVSLSFQVLAATSNIILAIQGREKLFALERAEIMPQTPLGALIAACGDRLTVLAS